MKKWMFLFFILFFPNGVWAQVSAWVENNPVTVGRGFHFYVEAKNVSGASEPDLSGIQGLQILDRRQQNQTSIVGTSVTRTLSWTYVLFAQHPGTYRIPALQVGSHQTQPIEIEAVAAANNNTQDEVRLEMNVQPKEAFPQQQIIARLRIIRSISGLENESITPLEIPGVQIEQIDQKSREFIEQGKRKVVTEITFALQKENNNLNGNGDELIIPEVRYQGDVVVQGQSSRSRLGNFNRLGNLFPQQTRRVYSNSNAVSVKIKPIPSGFKGWWLPTSSLTIEEAWQPDPPVFRVGEPVTRTIELRAKGVFGNQIPELNMNFKGSIKGYADQPKIETEKSPSGILGIRQEKWAIIPGQAGQLQIPGISVAWWDVETNQFRTAKLPPRNIKVLPAENAATTNSVTEQTTPVPTQTVIQTQPSEIKQRTDQKLWQILSASFALLWLVTLFLLYKKSRQVDAKQDGKNQSQNELNLNLQQARKKVELAVKNGEIQKIKLALLDWGKAMWQEDPPLGLEQISDRMPELREGIRLLNGNLYSQANESDSNMVWKNYFTAISDPVHFEPKKKISNLTSLYPQ